MTVFLSYAVLAFVCGICPVAIAMVVLQFLNYRDMRRIRAKPIEALPRIQIGKPMFKLASPGLYIESIVDIAASAAHEANRQYCIELRDRSQVDWKDLSNEAKESARSAVYAIMKEPDITPERLHERWCLFKKAHGWVYGPVKDETKKTHPCLVEYDDLPDSQKVKDVLFGHVVRGVLSAFGRLYSK